MSLILTYATLAAALAVLFFAATLVIQGYLYSQPASQLPLRAIVAGLLVGGFLTLWVYLNTRADSRDKYGTLFEFNPTASVPFNEFEAVRKLAAKDLEGKPREATVAFKRAGSQFVETADLGKPFRLSTSDAMTIALLIKEAKDPDTKVRYDAELDTDGKYLSSSNKIFREVNGRRFLEFGQTNVPASIQVPNRGAFLGALLLNLLHYGVWLVAFWPVLRYTSGVALMLTAGCATLVMLFVMPILFDRNRAVEAPATVVVIGQTRTIS